MDSVAPARKIVNVPLDRIKGGDSSAQENSIDDLSARTIEASTSETLENGGANTDSRSGVSSFSHISSWSKTALLSPAESTFLSLVFTDGLEFARSVFQDATGPWATPRVSAKLKVLAAELEAVELSLMGRG